MEDHGNEVKTCNQCGSVVTMHKTLSGTLFFIPVSNEYLEAIFRACPDTVDNVLHDRLVRAEKIISELRRENAELKTR